MPTEQLHKEQEEFLRAIFDSWNGLDNPLFEIRRIKEIGKNDRITLPCEFYKTLEELQSDWQSLLDSQKDGFNVYFGVNPRSGRRGTKEDIEYASAFYADLDFYKIKGGKEEATKKLDEFHLSPTAIIESGNGLHAYWLFHEAVLIENREKHEAINKALCKALGSDSVQDISRILRLPGTQNLKDPEQPRPCRLVSLDKSRRYDPSDFEEVLDVNVPSGNSERLGPIPNEVPEHFSELLKRNPKLRKTWEGKRPDLDDQTRSGYDMALANLLVGNGFSDEEIAAVLKEFPHGKGPDGSLHYLSRTIQKAWETTKTNGTANSKSASASDVNSFEPPEYWELLDAHNLKDWPCKPTKWIVEGIIAEGNLVIVAGPSQARKSLLFLYISRKLVQGGKLFGEIPVNPVKKVLYLCLEDPIRRVKERLTDAEHEFPGVPNQESLAFLFAPDFKLNDTRMSSYLEHLIEQHSFDVVLIDTYQKATPGLSSFNDEQQSLVLHWLTNVTRKLGVTLIVLDHVRKDSGRNKALSMHDIKGTGGKAQNADVVILIERSGNNQIKFRSLSKDWDQPVGFLLDVSPQGSQEPKFKYIGNLGEMGTHSQSKAKENRLMVLKSMKPGEWVSTGELAKATGLSSSTVLSCLKALITDDKVEHNGQSNRWRKYRRINGEPNE